MKKTILSLFILATLGITSCSSDSDGTATDATNVNLPTSYEPTSGNINTYARTGVNENTTLLDLTGQNSSLKFELLTTENVVELSADGRKIQTKTNLPQSAVGEKNIQYRVVQTGTSFSTANNLSFTIFLGNSDNLVFDVKIDQVVYDYNDGNNDGSFFTPFNGMQFDYDSNTSNVIKNVPWQYLVNPGNVHFKLWIIDENGNVTTPFTNNVINDVPGWKVCTISFLNSTDTIGFVIPRNIPVKSKYVNSTTNNSVILLKVFKTIDIDTGIPVYTFMESIDTDCGTNTTFNGQNLITFNCNDQL
jgi:hypothetical protein